MRLIIVPPLVGSEPFTPPVIASEAKQSHSTQDRLHEESDAAQDKL